MNNKNLMYLISIGGISLAIALGGAGLGIALNSGSKTIKSEINSPIKYGKLNWNIPNAAQMFAPTNNKNDITAFTVNSEKTIVDAGFWTKILETKGAVEKSTERIQTNGLTNHVSGYKNTVTFRLTSVSKSNAFDNTAYMDFVVIQNWNSKGELVHEIDAVSQSVDGIGKAANDLFGGKIRKDTDLTKYVFAKTGATPKSDGSDADYAWTIDAKTGAVKMISKIVFADKDLSITLSSAKRATTFLG